MVFVSVLLCLVSCGGGGGGESTAHSPASNDEVASNLVEDVPPANTDYSGYLYLHNYSTYSMFDIKSGIAYSIRDNVRHVSSTNDAKNFITFYQEFDSDKVGDWRVEWFDNLGQAQKFSLEDDPFEGIIKISDSNLNVALGVSNRVGETFAVINNNFDLLYSKQYQPEEFPFASWAWFDNGDLIYADGNQLYRVSNFTVADNSESVSLIATLPFPPSHLDVNPEGTKISFNMLSDDGSHHIYVLDIASGSLTQVTDSTQDEHGASWSPDGKFIAFNHGPDFANCVDYFCVSNCPSVSIAPAESNKIWVSEESDSEAYAVQQYFENGQELICSHSFLEWRANSIPLAPKNPAMPELEQINSGLTGTLIYEAASKHIARLSLSNGVFDTIATKENYPPELSVSLNRGEIAVVEEYFDDGHHEHITVMNLSGQILETLQVRDTSGVPKLSPDGQFLAVEYHSVALEDEPTVSIVSIFNRELGQNHVPSFHTRLINYDEWEWTPNNELILSKFNQLYIADKEFNEISHLVSLPNKIKHIRLSPDGNKLGFAMNGHIWLIDLQAENILASLTQLTTSSRKETSLAWSPDGKYILITYSDSFFDEAYVVPADGEQVFIANEKYIESSSIKLQRIRDDGTVSVSGDAGNFYWIE